MNVGVVVLAYGAEPMLGEVLDSVAASKGVAVDLVVVDNGYTGREGEELRARPLRWLTAGGNTGFTGGCNLGAAALSSPYIAFLNSDAVLDPTALSLLAEELSDNRAGIATAQVRLYDEPGVINSAGNPVHYSMLSWAGGWGDPASAHASPARPASASGCLMMVRREVFEELQGFNPDFFAYCEDAELSMRAWQAGYRVHYVPEARVWHKYEYSRNPQKYFLLERNRWLNILTLYQGSTLLRLGLGLAVVEAGIWASAARGGWLEQKIAAWRWLLANRGRVRARRQWVQSQRRVPDRDLLPMLERRLEPSERSGEGVPGPVNVVVGALGRLGGKGSPPS